MNIGTNSAQHIYIAVSRRYLQSIVFLKVWPFALMSASLAPFSSRQQKENLLENIAGNSANSNDAPRVSHASSHQVAGRDIDLCIQSHSHHSNAVTSVLFAGRLIVTGSLDGTMTLINYAFSEIIDRLTVSVKCGGITCISGPLSSESATGTFIAGTESGRLAKVSFTDSTVRRCTLLCRSSA